ncbi:MAG: hypothetical protein ABI700_02270 [Chloroflexota bacterium]
MNRPIQGVNINPRVPQHRPQNASALQRLGYCRFVYIVNNGQRNLNDNQSFTPDVVDPIFAGSYLPLRFEAAAALYQPFIDAYVHQDVTPILVFTHETFGEGWNVDFGGAMQNPDLPGTKEKWHFLSQKLAAILEKVAARCGTNVVYQIWNEQDQASGAAVGVPAVCYADMLETCARAIQRHAGNAIIITGGHTGSDSLGYWEKVRHANRFVDTLSGIDFHPYDCGINIFAEQGANILQQRLDDKLWAWQQRFTHMTGQSLWITEFGCGGSASENTAALYAKTFFTHLMTRWKNTVKAAVWFGWGDMNPGAGCYAIAPNGVDRRSKLWAAFASNTDSENVRTLPPAQSPVTFNGPGAPPLPDAFNHQYELQLDTAQFRSAWRWARGSGSGRWLELLATPDAPYSSPDMRTATPSPKYVEEAIRYLAPGTTQRYIPASDRDGKIIATFCNIFVNDATRILYSEIPNNPSNTTVHFMLQWLEQQGAAAGWRKTLSGEEAQNHVNDGHIAIMLWSSGQPEDHVALVRPGQGNQVDGFYWPRVAQAGAIVTGDVSAYSIFRWVWQRDSSKLAFYLHA